MGCGTPAGNRKTSDFDGVELSLEAFNVPCENASTPVPMLYQSGYLTIDYYNKEDDVYVLHFPNYEVRQGMVYSLTNYPRPRTTSMSSN